MYWREINPWENLCRSRKETSLVFAFPTSTAIPTMLFVPLHFEILLLLENIISLKAYAHALEQVI
jgi:hypothetical protein